MIIIKEVYYYVVACPLVDLYHYYTCIQTTTSVQQGVSLCSKVFLCN